MKKEELKNLSNFKEDIHRCSKCGICQSACPLFEITGNECTVSRGQFIMLKGVLNGKLDLNKNINKYLDLCLKCNKCTKFCPSEINALDIILAAKADYFKKSFWGKIYALLESKYVFGTMLYITEKLCSLFTRKYKSKKFQKKVVYFGGCINKLHPDINNYVKKLLNTMEIEVIDVNFDCCGMLFLTTGNLDRFVEVIKKNIKNLPEDIDYLLTDCASCNWAWKQYKKYVNDDELCNKIKDIEIKSLYDILEEGQLKFKSKKKISVTYHKPCHEESESALNIIKNIENINYKELEGYDECCGFAGFEHPQTLKTISSIFNKKRANLSKINTNYIITSCVGCLISLKIISFFKQKVCRLITFLKNNTEV